MPLTARTGFGGAALARGRFEASGGDIYGKKIKSQFFYFLTINILG
jgi:hypothetical protein